MALKRIQMHRSIQPSQHWYIWLYMNILFDFRFFIQLEFFASRETGERFRADKRSLGFLTKEQGYQNVSELTPNPCLEKKILVKSLTGPQPNAFKAAA